eukprot:TRINITY_DN1484_c0_g1_i2.p1 TRINITY_DN1484_c0_g1~~TRINITY_DN1484_c0_g1_i2.p1  ORF type:complete len:603 (+),score=253.12 TRINITY_DN1484_c0_g1_i2:55-1863(+)
MVGVDHASGTAMMMRRAAVVIAGAALAAAAETAQMACELPANATANMSKNDCSVCMAVAVEEDTGSGIPLWISVTFGLILLCLSGVFSGLTLGLLGLDGMALKAIADSGTGKAKEYALTIMPVRKDGNLLLCTLLLGNVMVNVMIPILLADLTGGMFGFIFSTVFIVIFGEIVPQATCSKHALRIGAAAVPLVRFFIFILFVLAKPIALILDRVLGQDMGQVFDKDELKNLLWQHLHEDKLDKREFKIISRALDLQKTEVDEIMTPEDKIYKLNLLDHLTSDKLAEIWQSGHSRIPVVEQVPDPERRGQYKETYVGVLYTKDLLTVRVEDKVTVQQILGFYNRGMPYTFDKSQKLDKVLELFRAGKSHMAFVSETVSRGGDPSQEIVGLVTLEDVIEQLVGEEIVDEHDQFEDIGASRRKKVGRDAVPFRLLRAAHSRLSPDQGRAIAKFLEFTLADPLAMLAEEQLFQLVMTTGVREYRLPVKETPRSLENPNNVWVYKRGRPCEWFTMVLSGKLETICGEENFRAEVGANQYIGARVLREGGSVKSDFDCRVLEGPVRVLQITYADLEKAKKFDTQPNSSFDKLEMSAMSGKATDEAAEV